MNVNSVKGLINGTTIQCTFTATVPDATTKAQSSTYSLAIVTGTLSSKSNTNLHIHLHIQHTRKQNHIQDHMICNHLSSTTCSSLGTGVLGAPVNRVQTPVLDISDASSSSSILTTVAATTVTTTTVATSTVANSGQPIHLALSQGRRRAKLPTKPRASLPAKRRAIISYPPLLIVTLKFHNNGTKKVS